jgi:hypothetical protein
MINFVSHVTKVQPLAFGAEVKSIVVRTGSGPVSVRGSERSGVSGERRSEHGWQAPVIEERVEGDTLVLEGNCDFVSHFWCGVS